MKKRFTLICLLFLVSFSFLNAGHYDHLEGVYFHRYQHVRIKVKDWKRGIRVKGIDRHCPNEYVRFETRDGRHFEDNRGNRVRIRYHRHDVEIIYKDRRGRVDVYTRQEDFRRRDHFDHRDRNRYDNDWDRRYSDEYFDDRTDRWREGTPDRGERHGSLQGTYETSDGKRVAVVTTREGFKAKFSGERSWKTYTASSRGFADRDGNIYMVNSDGSLTWNGKYSGRQIRIYKISDEVQY